MRKNELPHRARQPKKTPVADASVADAVNAADASVARYTFDQLLKSSTYSHRRDILRALLDPVAPGAAASDGGLYSHAEVLAHIEQFFESPVGQLHRTGQEVN